MFMCMDFCLHVFLCIIHVPGASEGQNSDIGFYGTEVIDRFEQPNVLRIKPASSERATMLLATETLVCDILITFWSSLLSSV